MGVAVDPRVTPARPDLAAEHLRSIVEAERFAPRLMRRVTAPSAPIRSAPRPDAPLLTEALRGEAFAVYESGEEGWSWGQLETDGYVGYLPSDALGEPEPEPSHRVAALRTFVFPGASIKVPPVAVLPFGARVAAGPHDARFMRLAEGGFVAARHLAPVGTVDSDPVAVAERFLGAPYLWGGRTSLGLDCSGLVQSAFAACGIALPRDSDQQEAATVPVEGWRAAALERGDLMFWKGHVALARGDGTLIHANAFHMAVAVEDAEAAVARIAAAGDPVSSVRRVQG